MYFFGTIKGKNYFMACFPVPLETNKQKSNPLTRVFRPCVFWPHLPLCPTSATTHISAPPCPLSNTWAVTYSSNTPLSLLPWELCTVACAYLGFLFPSQTTLTWPFPCTPVTLVSCFSFFSFFILPVFLFVSCLSSSLEYIRAVVPLWPKCLQWRHTPRRCSANISWL